MKKTFLYFSLALMFISCNGDDDMSTAPPVQTGPVTFETITKRSLTGNEGISQSNVVITNDVDWTNLLNQINSIGFVTTDLNPNPIDFNSEMLVAVISEQKPDLWFVEITSVIENANDITITSQETGGGFLQISQPYHIIKIPKTNKSFVFQ